MMWWWHDYWPMPWAFGPLLMFIFLALCMGMMWLMMRRMHGHGGRHSDALAILQERFARGEISQAEYLERKETLEA